MVMSVQRHSRPFLHLVGSSEQRISGVLDDRIRRAFTMEGAAREMALDANARLVTELRLAKLWPVRPAAPEGVEPPDYDGELR